MDSQSSYKHTDEVKLLSNILREPASRSGDESGETTAEILSEPTPAPVSQSKDESLEMAAESNTTPAGDGAQPQRPSSSASGVRGALWRFLVLCVQPIFSHLRDYLLGPVHAKFDAKFDAHATESRDAMGRIQLQVQVIRADLDVLPKQLVHLEFQARNFAKQLIHLESRFGFLAEQLKHLESQANGTSLSSMNSEAVVIVGSGGHAKVVIELIRAEGKYQIKGCTGLGEAGFVLGDVPVLGTDNVLPAVLANGAKKAFVALGDNHVRLRLLAKVSEMGFELINAVSPNAVVSPSASLGRGIAIMAGAVINASAEIGDGAIINTNAGVDHDCRIGKGAHIGPGSALAGKVEIGCESFLGAGTCVVPGVRIGSRVIVGAGSVVVRDIPDDVIAMGAPARVTGGTKTPAEDLSD
jgi:UDP-perosamine 4-acetyltransferase